MAGGADDAPPAVVSFHLLTCLRELRRTLQNLVSRRRGVIL
jgi:hypothetical protein